VGGAIEEEEIEAIEEEEEEEIGVIEENPSSLLA